MLRGTSCSRQYIYQHQGGYQDAELNSTNVFGAPGHVGSGWLDFYPESRGELFFMLDEVQIGLRCSTVYLRLFLYVSPVDLLTSGT